VSPFVGRLDDVATDGMELIQQIVEIYRNYGFETEVLVASVRHPMHVVAAAAWAPTSARAGAGHRVALQAPAHGHRHRPVPEGLAAAKGATS